jgi:ribosomal protein S27AE
MPRKSSKWGSEHQKRRAKLIARWRPGDPCSRCGFGMFDRDRLQLGHPEPGNGMRSALEHDHCNESAGGVKGALIQGKTIRTKTCPICHVQYKATHKDQIACSREHAAAVKRGDAPWPVSGRPW